MIYCTSYHCYSRFPSVPLEPAQNLVEKLSASQTYAKNIFTTLTSKTFAKIISSPFHSTVYTERVSAPPGRTIIIGNLSVGHYLTIAMSKRFAEASALGR
ncbi:MAG TPA: hypothetical protein VJK48_00645 [Chlamydiales bacterium]|nr:MAG: hypothetical protein A3F67_08525 [Verrucomicrobia bacterium RIFCSPHIGHO2_12_FULL_41_10]HLB52202.1 hypothetical protein [Chlamydiales bacterium]